MSGLYLQETAVEAVVTVLKAHLADELTAIDAAKGDGIATDKPTAEEIIDYARGADLHMRNVLVEVYSDRSSALAIEPAETDRSRLSADNTVTVRVSVAARDSDVPGALFKKVSRTCGAIIGLLAVEHFDLDAVAEMCSWTGTAMRNLPGDQIVRQAEVVFVVRTRETHS